jgi:hypothetical protein
MYRALASSRYCTVERKGIRTTHQLNLGLSSMTEAFSRNRGKELHLNDRMLRQVCDYVVRIVRACLAVFPFTYSGV